MSEPADELLSDLCATLHALSAPADSNPQRPEELALHFGEAVLIALSRDPAVLTAEQVQILNTLASLLRNMSDQKRSLWTTSAVQEHPAWEQVRALATQALRQLDPFMPASRTLR